MIYNTILIYLNISLIIGIIHHIYSHVNLTSDLFSLTFIHLMYRLTVMHQIIQITNNQLKLCHYIKTICNIFPINIYNPLLNNQIARGTSLIGGLVDTGF